MYAEDVRRKLEAGILEYCSLLPRAAALHNRGIKRNVSIAQL